MTFKKLFAFGLVAAVLVACGDDASSGPVTGSNEDSSSSVCENCNELSSSSNVIASDATQSSDSTSSGSLASSLDDSSSSSSVMLSSSSSVLEGYVDPSTVVAGTMTDERDGQTYKTVTIGTQTWMAENLNYAYLQPTAELDSSSFCYNDSASYCEKYGRMYLLSAAMDSAGIWTSEDKSCGFDKTCNLGDDYVQGICPVGWHLPTLSEWFVLLSAVNGANYGGNELKATSGWNDRSYPGSGNGTDAYSFAALPAGYRASSGYFYEEGDYAYFWSSTEYTVSDANVVYLYYKTNAVVQHIGDRAHGLSVRCVKD